jgi:hypothetical protein
VYLQSRITKVQVWFEIDERMLIASLNLIWLLMIVLNPIDCISAGANLVGKVNVN